MYHTQWIYIPCTLVSDSFATFRQNISEASGTLTENHVLVIKA